MPLDSAVEIDFSEEMLPSTLRLSTVPPVSFNLASWVPGPRRAVFSASAPLDQDTQYTVSVEGRDVAGNSLSGTSSLTFMTVGPAPDATRPTLVESSPPPDVRNVPRTTAIKLTFSEPMDKASVARAFSITTPTGSTVGTVAWNDPGTEVVFTPGTAFPYGADVSLVLSHEATDLSGNAVSDYYWSFRIIRLSVLRLEFDRDTSTLASTEPIPQPIPWTLGDDSLNMPYHGFVSFSLQPLSSMGVSRINSAAMKWFPHTANDIDTFNSLGRFMVDPVNYGLSTDGVYTTPSIGTPLFLTYQDLQAQGGVISIPVTALVIDAWTNMRSRFERVQFRLKFEYMTDNDNSLDEFLLNANDLVLELTCEHP